MTMLKTYLILTIVAIIAFLTGNFNEIQNNHLHLTYMNYINVILIWLIGLLTVYLLETTKTGQKMFDIFF